MPPRSCDAALLVPFALFEAKAAAVIVSGLGHLLAVIAVALLANTRGWAYFLFGSAPGFGVGFGVGFGDGDFSGIGMFGGIGIQHLS